MPKHPVYLWTLPMFHCNGWCFPWSIAARAGVNVCLRKVEAKAIFDLIREHTVTHYCGAPIVHATLANAPKELRAGISHRVNAMVAGAAPPAAMIEGMEALGFELTHVYGLTEVYGPAAVCAKQDGWSELPVSERARLNARQGVRYHLQEAVAVLDPSTMKPVPADGATMGELMFKGNITMKGYLKNPHATEQAFAGGWFHTGDLGVMHPDGYVKIKDRSKDIIISGGENISSIEIEDVLYRHPAVMAAAVVARPDPKWGETPCAFIELRTGTTATAQEIIAHCRLHLPGFKLPRAVEFGELPKTSTGKIQKFELRARAGSVKAIDV
jgi:fatty-acyl-CoA synthase